MSCPVRDEALLLASRQRSLERLATHGPHPPGQRQIRRDRRSRRRGAHQIAPRRQLLSVGNPQLSRCDSPL